MTIPISVVDLGDEEIDLLTQVVRSGRLAQGPMVDRLETEFMPWCGAEHVIAVNNGTTALVAALQSLELQPGDEVITSPFSFVATLNAIVEAGATAVFADIGEDFCLDPASVRERITSRTRVLLPVHLYGQAADMPALLALADEYGLAIVEDAAQAHGAAVAGRPVGSWGVGCFSLYATKNLTSGEGGLVTTNDAAIADRLRLLRNQGMRSRYQYEMVGHNYRMTELQAAVALPQLARLGARTEARRRNAHFFNEGLKDVEGLYLPSVAPEREHVWHQYTLLTEGGSVGRDALADALADKGVTTGVYYPRLMHDYDCFKDHPQLRVEPTPRAARTAQTALSLPVHPFLTEAELQHVVASVREVFGA